MPEIAATPAGNVLKVVATSGAFLKGDSIDASLRTKKSGDQAWTITNLNSTTVTGIATEETLNVDLKKVNLQGAARAEVVVTVKRGSQESTYTQNMKVYLPASGLTISHRGIRSEWLVTMKATDGRFYKGDTFKIRLITTTDGQKSSKLWGTESVTMRSNRVIVGPKRKTFWVKKSDVAADAERAEIEVTLTRNGATVATTTHTLYSTPLTALLP